MVLFGEQNGFQKSHIPGVFDGEVSNAVSCVIYRCVGSVMFIFMLYFFLNNDE